MATNGTKRRFGGSEFGPWVGPRDSKRSRSAGASLQIDLAVLDPPPDEFFDFLTRLSVFENKAPGEVFDEDDVLLSTARTLLLQRKWRLELSSLADTNQSGITNSVPEFS